jgi:uncharacterized metal-binding protein
MPDGRIHFVANGVAGAALVLLATPEVKLPVLIGAAIGAFVTPDLDLESTTHSEALLRQIPVVGLLFQVLWYPYALLHAHRGVSHWPIVGTLGRLAYLVVLAGVISIFALGWAALVGSTTPPPTLPQLTFDQAACLFAAWIAQDLVHLLLDALSVG